MVPAAVIRRMKLRRLRCEAPAGELLLGRGGASAWVGRELRALLAPRRLRMHYFVVVCCSCGHTLACSRELASWLATNKCTLLNGIAEEKYLVSGAKSLLALSLTCFLGPLLHFRESCKKCVRFPPSGYLGVLSAPSNVIRLRPSTGDAEGSICFPPRVKAASQQLPRCELVSLECGCPQSAKRFRCS